MMLRRLLKLVVAAATLLLAAGGVLLYAGLTRHPDASRFDSYAPASKSGSDLKVTFLGTATLLFDDGDTQIMTDGFFSRPSAVKLFSSRISSDEALIDAALRRAGIDRLKALVVLHSHYDHAMDVPAVVLRTGAVVVGSQSTANVARGGGIPEAGIRVAETGVPLQFGKFKVTLLPSRHGSTGYPNGSIDAPLSQPARAIDYKLGGAYAVLIEHDGRRVIVNGSAGYEPGALQNYRAETVFLGIGGLGRASADVREGYWTEMVEATQAKHVVAIHWDNFALPLHEPLRPLPRLLDNLDVSMEFLSAKARARGLSLTLPHAWTPFDAFAPHPRR